MSSSRERRLLARARGLDNPEDLAEEVTSILGGARAARVDPGALTNLAGAAQILGADSLSVYQAGEPRFTSDVDYTDAVEDVIADVQGRLAAAGHLHDELRSARSSAIDDLRQARRDLARAQAMHVSDPCDGCHKARQSAIGAAEKAISDARERIGICGAAIEVLEPLARHLREALILLSRVPEDLEEAYEPVYDLVRHGGAMPKDGDFITGDPRTA